MANDAQKKIVTQNQEIVKKLKFATTCIIGFHFLLSYFIRYKTVRFSRIFFTSLTILIILFLQNILNKFSIPKYNSNQTLSSNSLITEGYFFSTIFDAIYLLLFCLFLLSFSDKMRYSFLIIPLFAIVVVWVKVVKPWLFKSRFTDEGEAEKLREQALMYEKAKERAERGRRKYKY